jgi:hypothetical protein
MLDHVVVNQIRSSIDCCAVHPRHANLTIPKTNLVFRVSNSYGIFAAELTLMPASILIHRPFAQDEKLRSEFFLDISLRKRHLGVKPTNVPYISCAPVGVLGILMSAEVLEVSHQPPSQRARLRMVPIVGGWCKIPLHSASEL